MKTRRKRRHLSPAESSAEKKSKQSKIENFILPTKCGTDSKVPMNRNASSLSAPDAIVPVSASESFLCHSPNDKTRLDTPLQDSVDPCELGSCNPFKTSKKPSGTGKGTPLSPCHCKVAKYLSEICFISAETLILLLGRLNNIEVHLDSFLKLTAAGARRGHQLSLERGAHLQPSILIPHESSMTDRDMKVTRTLQPLQVVLNIPCEDSMLWNSRGRILSSLSTLLDCHLKVPELHYFFFLPSILNYNRVFLAFRSPYLPKKIFRVAHRLRSLGIIPLRVFKDNEPRALFKTSHPILSKTQGKGRVERLHPTSTKDARLSAKDELLTLKNKLTVLLATSRSCCQENAPVAPASPNTNARPTAPAHSSFLSNDCDLSTMDLEISGSEPNKNTKRSLEPNLSAPLIDLFVSSAQPCSVPFSTSSNSETPSHSCTHELMPVRAKSVPTNSELDSTKTNGPSIKIPSAVTLDLNRHLATEDKNTNHTKPDSPIQHQNCPSSSHPALNSSRSSSFPCEVQDFRPGALLFNDPHFAKFTSLLCPDQAEIQEAAESCSMNPEDHRAPSL